jgi:hypothetical protein
MIFVPHRKHTFGDPRPVTGIALLNITWVEYFVRCACTVARFSKRDELWEVEETA